MEPTQTDEETQAEKTEEGRKGRKAAGRAKGKGTLERHGRKWRARWVVGGKVFRRSTGESDKREAEKRLAEFVAPYYLKREAKTDARAAKAARRDGFKAIVANALADSARAKRAAAGRLSVPFAKVWQAFDSSLAREPVAPATNRMYEACWDAFAGWVAKNRPALSGLSDVDVETAEAYMRSLKARFSAKSFNNHRSLLMMVWRILDEEAGLDGFNPWTHIKPLGKATHTRRELTVEELARVVAPLEGDMRVLFAIGIYTGLRLGDAVLLDWGAVDLARGFVQVTPHKTAKHGTVVRIPLFPALAAILSETPPERRRGKIFPALAAEYKRDSSYAARRVKRIFEAAGIETQAETGRGRKAVSVGFHSLRHTFVSLCANAGVPLHIVQAIVGHTNAAMTAHYFHVSDDALQGAVAVLPDVFKPPAALPAHGDGNGVCQPLAKTIPPCQTLANEDAGAFEVVPADVAKVARLLTGCTPGQLARVEKFTTDMLAAEGER
jgi:integrase